MPVQAQSWDICTQHPFPYWLAALGTLPYPLCVSYPALLEPERASNQGGGSRVMSDLCPGACRLRDVTELALAAQQPAGVAGMGWPLATDP